MTKEEVYRLFEIAMKAKQEWFIAWERYVVASKELHDSEIKRCPCGAEQTPQGHACAYWPPR